MFQFIPPFFFSTIKRNKLLPVPRSKTEQGQNVQYKISLQLFICYALFIDVVSLEEKKIATR